MVRCLDCAHRLCKVLAHLDMLVKHMMPCHVVHLNEMVLGVANLSNDMALGNPSRLRARADENRRLLQAGSYTASQPRAPVVSPLCVNYDRRSPVGLSEWNQVVLHDEAEALGVAVHRRYLGVGGCAL